jgi:hypothetical protein
VTEGPKARLRIRIVHLDDDIIITLNRATFVFLGLAG